MITNDPHWQDRLVRAELRGFEFLTESHAAKGGRRLVVHEYPGAEEPQVQDLGGKAWDWKLVAYFIGPNYDLERNGFLVKLNEPGATWLMHPWLGKLWVRARDWTLHESNDKGGYATVAIDFVPGGEQPYVVSVDKVDVAYTRIIEFSTVAQEDFTARLRPLSATAMTAFIAAVQAKLEILRTAIALATLPLTWANQITGLIAGVKGDLATLMATPQAYANAFGSLANALGSGADRDDFSDTSRCRLTSRLAKVATTSSSGLTSIPGSSLTSVPGNAGLSSVLATDSAARYNLAQEDALRGRLLVASAAQVALTDYQAEGDRDAALASVVSAIDALLPIMPDTVFQAAVAARTALIEALLAQELLPATERDVTGPIPSVVLAYRLQVDEAVFLARNAVRHPLFVTGHIYG